MNDARTLYDEEILELAEPRKYGSLKKLGLSALAFSIPFAFSLDADFREHDAKLESAKGKTYLKLGPPEAEAAAGYIPVYWCPYGSSVRLIVTRQDKTEPVRTIPIPGNRGRYNITGLEAGGLYEVKIDGSSKGPIGVARILGNAYSGPGSENSVGSADMSLCNDVYTGRNKNPADRQKCDFDGDGLVTNVDMMKFTPPSKGGNWGVTQPNPLGNTYEDCSGGRCVALDCNPPY